MITNTSSVGLVRDAVVKFYAQKAKHQQPWLLPVVAETYDGYLNDTHGFHIKEEHVFAAIESAKSGAVAEGNVGGGTGLMTCDFKSGIGTSSRKLPQHEGGYIVGVLVSSNFGRMVDLRVDGVPVGEVVAPRYADYPKRGPAAGSIIVVVATNAPLLPHQVGKLCKRAALGAGRIGSYAEHGSGEFVIGFSNANSIPRVTRKMVYRMKVLLDRSIDPLYKATVEAAEEAILNSMCMAETMLGHSGHIAPALPLGETAELVRRYRPGPAPT
jgi:D-aminopeptidase